VFTPVPVQAAQERSAFRYALAADAFVASGGASIDAYDARGLGAADTARLMADTSGASGTLGVPRRRELAPPAAAWQVCAWLMLARTDGAPALPLLYGTPDRRDAGTTCAVRVSAHGTDGYVANGTVLVRVEWANSKSQGLHFHVAALYSHIEFSAVGVSFSANADPQLLRSPRAPRAPRGRPTPRQPCVQRLLSWSARCRR
jgi:hypothetical protein